MNPCQPQVVQSHGYDGTCSYLGSVRLVTNKNGTIVSRHHFLPFGEELTTAVRPLTLSFGQADGVNQKFTAKERDSESGLNYFGARYYGSASGRFTTADWSASPQPVPYADFSNPQTLNQYAYVLNNPLAHPDADGHCFPLCAALAGGGAAIAEESPLLFAGPPGWAAIGAIALVVGGIA